MQAILILYDIHRGLRAKWLSIDCNLYKAPLGGEKTGRNPTDRGKLGGKRSVCVEEDGIVLSFVHPKLGKNYVWYGKNQMYSDLTNF